MGEVMGDAMGEAMGKEIREQQWCSSIKTFP
jgi:hypothetical protein